MNPCDKSHPIQRNICIPMNNRVKEIVNDNCYIDFYEAKYASTSIEREKIQQYLHDNRKDLLRVVIHRAIFYTYQGFRGTSSCVAFFQNLIVDSQGPLSPYVYDCIWKTLQNQDHFHHTSLANKSPSKQKTQCDRYLTLLKAFLEAEILSRIDCALYLTSRTLRDIGIISNVDVFHCRMIKLRNGFTFRQVKKNVGELPPVSKIMTLLCDILLESFDLPDVQDGCYVIPLSKLDSFHTIVNKYKSGSHQIDPKFLLDILIDICIDQAADNAMFWVKLISKNKDLALSESPILKEGNASMGDMELFSRLVGFKFDYFSSIDEEPYPGLYFTAALLVQEKLISLERLLPYLTSAQEIANQHIHNLAKALLLVGDGAQASNLIVTCNALDSHLQSWLNTWVNDELFKYQMPNVRQYGYRFDSDTEEEEEEKNDRDQNSNSSRTMVLYATEPLHTLNMYVNGAHRQSINSICFLDVLASFLQQERPGASVWMNDTTVALLLPLVKQEIASGKRSNIQAISGSIMYHVLLPSLPKIPATDMFSFACLLPYHQRTTLYHQWDEHLVSHSLAKQNLDSQLNTCFQHVDKDALSALIQRYPTRVAHLIIPRITSRIQKWNLMIMDAYCNHPFAQDIMFAFISNYMANHEMCTEDKENVALPSNLEAMTLFTRLFYSAHQKDIRSSLFEYLVLYTSASKNEKLPGNRTTSHFNIQFCLYTCGQSDSWKRQRRLQKQVLVERNVLGKRKLPLGSLHTNNRASTLALGLHPFHK
ncbi:hypothetical protein DM01DRAFT_1385796 [Hesseltinella vesiculosa]|uniref:THO complex subunit 2 N-terminal domain-containing protein n=1 Tax=Hesseltinella vesiculosa TaxID=101127 RepID=A0A1X2G8K8_9FUNG|nr:hypothetical protein DM01DRAFT_1385796 [Hesseltinella vesiculosa]